MEAGLIGSLILFAWSWSRLEYHQKLEMSKGKDY